MKKQILFTFLALGFAFSTQAATGPNLNPLKVDKDFESGCGCSAWNKKDEILVFSTGERDPAIVRIDGKLTKLPMVSSTEKTTTPRKGDRFTRLYASGPFKLKMDYKTIFVCGPKDEECEVTRYSIKGALRDGARVNELEPLGGDCGC